MSERNQAQKRPAVEAGAGGCDGVKMKVVKRHFVPDDKGSSISIMNQAKRAMIEGKPLPPHVANYLLEVMYSVEIDGETNAQRAFGLTRQRGNPPKTTRNVEFALKVNELRALGETREDALTCETAWNTFQISGVNSIQ